MEESIMNDLYEKYQATEYQTVDPINPLIFILRKAELAQKLNITEWHWLKINNLHSVIAIIENQESYRQSIANCLKQEIPILKAKWQSYLPLNSFVPSTTEIQETIFLMYRMNILDEIENFPQSYFKNNYCTLYNINHLKKVLSITENIPFDETSLNILRKLETPDSIFEYQDIEWLHNNNIKSAISLLSKKYANLLNEFNLTEEIYGIESLKLHIILQKLKKNLNLSPDEIIYLKEQHRETVLGIAMQAEFLKLKNKYKASSMPDDLPSSHLYKVLKKLDAGLALPEPDINFLKKRKLNDTLKIVYKPEADKLIHKLNSGHELRPDDIAWCKEHHFEEIIFLWLKNDFDVKHRHVQPDSKLFTILQKLKDGNRLIDDEIVWLESENLLKPSTPIFKTHHRLEAEYSEAEFLRTKGYWNLVNASAHWRKAENPARALEKTEKLDLKSIKPAKLTAALLTTRGGALRDVSRLEEAEECALEAIKHYPDSYNPYTLMGALCYGTGRFEEGRRWFEEAIKRGATAQDEDVEIKRILRKKEDHNDLIEYLLKRDPHRFAWVKKFQQNSHKAVLPR
ncbi:MAG: hypothetical protein NTX45_15755 [Proteobacteria bacterium]|nr:hypothetical protein [Pseudomonadota bacterium]